MDHLTAAKSINCLIRNLHEEDIPGLIDMYRNFQPKNYIMGLPPLVDPVFIRWIHNLLREQLNLIAVTGDTIIGHASVIDAAGADFCELIVFVHQEYRGSGIGRRLVDEICRRALSLGKHRIWLMVESSNISAIKTYYCTGFRTTKVYGDVYEMELDTGAPFDFMGD